MNYDLKLEKSVLPINHSAASGQPTPPACSPWCVFVSSFSLAQKLHQNPNQRNHSDVELRNQLQILLKTIFLPILKIFASSVISSLMTLWRRTSLGRGVLIAIFCLINLVSRRVGVSVVTWVALSWPDFCILKHYILDNLQGTLLLNDFWIAWILCTTSPMLTATAAVDLTVQMLLEQSTVAHQRVRSCW